MDAKTSNGESRKVQVLPLSPLHIGSGDVLKGKHDYMYFEREKVVVLLDHKKVLALLPVKEKAIGEWLSVIDKEDDLYEWLKKYQPSLKPGDVALEGRIIELDGALGPRNGKDFRTMLQTGTGQALLPGSSLKGALRTVLWRHLLRERYPEGLGLAHLQDSRGNLKDGALGKKIFGEDPNSDFLRGLVVTDAAFSTTRCYAVNTMNKVQDGWEIPDKYLRFVEAVPAYSSGECKMRLKRQGEGKLWEGLPATMEDLFKMVRQHTKELLAQEASFWNREAEDCPCPGYSAMLEEMQEKNEELGEGECILRIGQGSGYAWMTGGWQEELLSGEDWKKVVQKIRGPRYAEGLAFPKTRSFAAGRDPMMGFVKLRLL